MSGTFRRRVGLSPRSVAALARQRRQVLLRARNRDRPRSGVLLQVSRDATWEGDAPGLRAGGGVTSRRAAVYASSVLAFAREHGVRNIVDLGCGDFTVGARLVEGGLGYVGVDIVPDLVARNERLFGRDGVRFVCRDIIADELPDGDLCLVRQVLQHLSNAQIEGVLRNVERYRHVLVTEHYPALDVAVRPNVDKPCGEDVRVYDDSGVYLDAAPFGRRLSGPLLDVDAGLWLVRPGERLRTYLLESGAP